MHHTKIIAVVFAVIIAIAGFVLFSWPESGDQNQGGDSKVVATVGFNESTKGLATSVTPLELLEDSRCPIDVQCIQAGTVRILASIGAGSLTYTLGLGKPVTVGDAILTLTDILPVPHSGAPIPLADYRFTFSTEKVGESTTGTLSGTVGIGPLCPVEQDAVPCNPSPEVYAAQKVSVYKADKKTLITTLSPDDTGKFTTTLPVGEYWVETVEQKGIGSIKGAPAAVTIRPGATTILSIVIDTGIR